MITSEFLESVIPDIKREIERSRALTHDGYQARVSIYADILEGLVLHFEITEKAKKSIDRWFDCCDEVGVENCGELLDYAQDALIELDNLFSSKEVQLDTGDQ